MKLKTATEQRYYL